MPRPRDPPGAWRETRGLCTEEAGRASSETSPTSLHRSSNVRTLTQYWPEYVIEAVCLGLFMVSAASFATLLQHPLSPFSAWHASPLVQRIAMGIAMGLTAAAIIYSPLGARSGAHINPALTLTFARLGKIAPADAIGYVSGQFVGGMAGIIAAGWLLRDLPADPSVNYVATVPGPGGAAVAFVAEAAISFGMMLMVLNVSNTPRIARFTGLCAGALVATYITVEAPFSGISMNPARTFGPAILADTVQSLWIYFTAPLLGMLLAAESFIRVHGRARVRCAKLHHPFNVRCIFRCGNRRSPA
jgi:aquaporin Z